MRWHGDALKARQGATMIGAVVLLVAVMVLGMGMLSHGFLNSTVATNTTEAAKSFHAADGMMTMLAQEVISKRGERYTWTPGYTPLSLGAVTYTGSDTVGLDTMWVLGAGANGIHGRTSDNSHFEYVRMRGDLDVSVVVAGLFDSIGTSTSKLAGIMIREGVAANAKRVFWGVGDSAGSTVGRRAFRKAAGGPDSSKAWNQARIGHGLRVERKCDVFTLYLNQGLGWKRLEQFTAPMAEEVLVGFAVSPKKGNCLAKAKLVAVRGIPSMDTVPVGDFDVSYTMSKLWNDAFNISCRAYKTRNGKTAYTTSLRQLVAAEVSAGYRSYVEDSLIVPVTYYDYHANGSCPDFQKAGLNSVYLKNMVLRDTLDSERKPVGSYSSFWTNTGFRTCLYSGNGCLSGTPPDWKAGKSWSWWCNCYYNYTSGDFPTGGCEYKSTAANRNWYFSDNINQWFRPFGAPTARFDTLTGKWTNLLYDAAMKAYYGADVAARRAAGDTAMINMVVYDSLIWVRDTTYNPNDKNTYVYGKLCDTSCYTFCGANRTSVRKPSTPAGEYWQEFFHPLKGRGFGYDGPWSGTVGKWGSTAYASWGDFKNQNFSFAMELHRKFVADTGQIFVFRGNDDLWVFVKDSLIMDQGGIHMPVSDTVKVSNLVASGFLTRGTEYWFDLFYCERNGWGSEILMATNMMWYDAGQATQRRWKRDYGFLD